MSFLRDFIEAFKITRASSKKSFTTSELLPPWMRERPIRPVWNTERAVKQAYKGSSFVYACVNRIAKTAASVPWIASEFNPDTGAYEHLEGHPLETLLSKPNPWMDGSDLMERLVIWLYMGGNGILSKVRADDVVAELYPLPPDAMNPIPNAENFIDAYEYRYLGVVERIPAEDIVHLMFPDPNNIYWGMPPLQAIGKTVDIELEALSWQKVSFQNRAIADGVFSFEHEITKEQFEAARKYIREQKGIREPWVLGSGATWQQMSLTAAELDFINSRKFTREEICAVLGVPPPMIGLYERATLANIQESRRIFWVDTIIPLLETIQSAFNLQLAPEFGNEEIRLEFDTSGVEALQENYAEKVTTAKTLWDMGVPFNLINAQLELGFDELEGGNTGYVAGGLLPAVQAPANQDDGDDSPETVTRSKGLDEGQKYQQWKSYDTQRSQVEHDKASQVAALLLEEKRQIISRFRDDGVPGVIIYYGQEGPKRWREFLASIYRDVIPRFAQEAMNQLQSPKAHRAASTKQFDPQRAGVEFWIQATSLRKAELITESSQHDILRQLRQGLAAGEPEAELTSRIEAMYDRWAGNVNPEELHSRALTIAEGEVGEAAGYGSYAGAVATGLMLTKEWVTQGDDRVRASHAMLDGTVMDLDETFPNGLRWPLDSEGPVSEKANCRCFVVYGEA